MNIELTAVQKIALEALQRKSRDPHIRETTVQRHLNDWYRIDSAFLLPNAHCCLTKIVTLVG